MTWIAISILAYFFIALEIILDKFLLSSKRISHPAVYAFYSGLLSLGALAIFSPFGFHLINYGKIWPYLLAGIVFTYGILCLFFALNEGEASKVTPMVGAVIPVVTFLLSAFFLNEKLSHFQFLGVVILIFGGLLISFDLPIKIRKSETCLLTDKFFAGFGHTILAGTLLAVAFTAFKYFFERDNFINVFVWTRLGLFLGALTLLFFSFWREPIFKSLKKFKKPEKSEAKTGGFFVLGKCLGGSGSILVNYAIALGSVTVVSALVSAEYIFVFLLGVIFSLRFPEIFKEKGKFWDIVQKVGAIVVITVGIVLISLEWKNF
jgi:drug/metabolite transporter (DMT)-like permease